MINFLLISEVKNDRSSVEDIYDQIFPINKSSQINFTHLNPLKFDSNLSIETKLIEILNLNKIDVMFFQFPGLNNSNLIKIRKIFPNLKIAILCHECFGHYDEYKSCFNNVDYIILHELSKDYWQKKKSKIIFTPHTIYNSQSIFFSNIIKKDIDFYFSGTISGDRNEILGFLKQNLNCNFKIGEGRYLHNQSNKTNIGLIERSKSSIVFPFQKTRLVEEAIYNRLKNKSSWNGRSTFCIFFETLIFSQRYRELEIFLKDKQDYISYKSHKDLLNKIHHFTDQKHEDERKKIVDSAKKKMTEVFSEKNFEKILNNIMLGKNYYYPVIKSNVEIYNRVFVLNNYYFKYLYKNFKLFLLKFYKILAMVYHGQFKKIFEKFK